MLGAFDDDALLEENFQDMLDELCRSHAALLATMAPEGNLKVPPWYAWLLGTMVRFLLQVPGHLHENTEKHLLDERPGDEIRERDLES